MGRPKVIGKDARLNWLSRELGVSGACRLTEAAEALGCSSMTVRRDVAAAPQMFSTLGGFIVPATANPYRIERESDAHVAAKQAIAVRAIGALRPGDAVFLDCGSTIPHVARRLPAGLRLTVVTYALNVANALVAHPDIELVLLGGIYRDASASFEVDDPGRALVRFGLAAAGRRWLLADASKFGVVKPAAFADLREFDGVITAPLRPEGPEAAALGERLILAPSLD